MRQWPGLNTRLGWTLFNLLFISLYQNLLLLSIALPALYSAQSVAPLNSLDLMASVTFLVLVLVETVADNQQENFQNEKHRQLRSQKTEQTRRASSCNQSKGLLKTIAGRRTQGLCST